MSDLTAILAGALAALVLAALARLGGRRLESWIWPAGLVAAALVYVVAAARLGVGRTLLVEAAGLAAFGAVALVGLLFAPLVVALGWGLHVGWDLVIHSAPGGPGIVPAWYPALCVGFDLAIAAYLGISLRGGGILRGRPQARTAPVAPSDGAAAGTAAPAEAALLGPAPDWGVDPYAETDPLAERPLDPDDRSEPVD